MAEIDPKKIYACKSRETLVKFLENHAIRYVLDDNQIEFEKGSRYVIRFGDAEVILCDAKMNTTMQGSVFEIIVFLSGSVDVYV